MLYTIQSFHKLEQSTTERRQGNIPKEAPWKTSVLNSQFRRKRSCEFSTATSGTERNVIKLKK